MLVKQTFEHFTPWVFFWSSLKSADSFHVSGRIWHFGEVQKGFLQAQTRLAQTVGTRSLPIQTPTKKFVWRAACTWIAPVLNLDSNGQDLCETLNGPGFNMDQTQIGPKSNSEWAWVDWDWTLILLDLDLHCRWIGIGLDLNLIWIGHGLNSNWTGLDLDSTLIGSGLDMD